MADSQLDENDKRIGYSFNNPDTVSDYHAPKWGYLVSADELRYELLMGNRLTSSDLNQTVTNNTLLMYSRTAIGICEREFGIHILPRLNLYEERRNQSTGQRPERVIPEKYQEWVSSLKGYQKPLLNLGVGTNYAWQDIPSENYMFIKLDYRPLTELLNVRIVDPYYSNLTDILPMAREKKGFEASVEFFPSEAFIISQPFFSWGKKSVIRYPYNNFPDAFLFDYVSGYLNSESVPEDLREFIRKMAGIMVMAAYGDGKSAAIASGSASLNGISESFATTQSATSATFGARILQYQKENKEFYDRNKNKFGQAMMVAL